MRQTATSQRFQGTSRRTNAGNRLVTLLQVDRAAGPSPHGGRTLAINQHKLCWLILPLSDALAIQVVTLLQPGPALSGPASTIGRDSDFLKRVLDIATIC